MQEAAALDRRLPSLNGVRSFEAAARHLGFTLAARELYVTQGAVSRGVVFTTSIARNRTVPTQ